MSVFDYTASQLVFKLITLQKCCRFSVKSLKLKKDDY